MFVTVQVDLSSPAPTTAATGPPASSTSSTAPAPTFVELLKVSTRVRKQGKKRSALPSNTLTSQEHYPFVAEKTKKEKVKR